MRLKKIKLSGFKSFVDPTQIEFPQNLVGIVGPNGCGKSNTIDAVRWVMGESSAKQLRGESSSDVIFNGSASRKPVGQAVVELIFDNQDGMLGGEYAQYAEISIKRQAARDGQSIYYLNGTKCRRRDITDIFLGTGLGPRSYAIIEQGMISRLIEAKPDELRVYLEEAAGISKYKERRKETESRIEQTLSNLARLADIRTELEKQLQKLGAQAKAAEKYQLYKQEESTYAARLYAFRWQQAHAAAEHIEKKITCLLQEANDVEVICIACASNLETQRTAYQAAHQSFNQIQGEYYETTAELSKTQQKLELEQKQQKEWALKLEETQTHLNTVSQNHTKEQNTLLEVDQEILNLQPKLEQIKAEIITSTHALQDAEYAMQQGQETWHVFYQDASKIEAQAELTRKECIWKEETLQKTKQRIAQLTEEYHGLATESVNRQHHVLEETYQTLCQTQTNQLALKKDLSKELEALQSQLKTIELVFHQEQTALQECKGQLASLITLQIRALETQTPESKIDAPKLAELIQVEPGYEKVVEYGLGMMLGAYCVEHWEKEAATVIECKASEAMMLPPHQTLHLSRLAEKILFPHAAREYLAHMFVANSWQEAFTHRAYLQWGESILTPEGVFLGRNWIRRLVENPEKTGVLERQADIQSLQKTIFEKNQVIEDIEKQMTRIENQKKQLELNKEKQERDLEILQQQQNELLVQKEALKNKLQTLEDKEIFLHHTLLELNAEVGQLTTAILESKKRLEALLQSMVTAEETKKILLSEKESCLANWVTAKDILKTAEDQWHVLDVSHHALLEKQKYAAESVLRFKAETEHTELEVDLLKQKIKDAPIELDVIRKHLQHFLSQQKTKETLLAEARRAVETLEQTLKDLETSKHQNEQRLHEKRLGLEQEKLHAQALQLKQTQYQERIEETGRTLDMALSSLLPEMTEADYQQESQKIEQRILRLGPINLMAIHEHKELSERKTVLDAQCADLEQALNTLKEAIQKIDKETRDRFQTTFDAINQQLKILFAKIFEGGEALLEMTGTELLDAGVAVMARPPGKRNSSIHALSGGEKALTAIALVFSIFQLNPAPFCMLDEVDAPLDDANVSRYCRLLQEMANTIQFIFITHNKNTMELATELIGVTMQEPGVSRLVGVNIDEAIAWAETP